jgi:hypothetical protein
MHVLSRILRKSYKETDTPTFHGLEPIDDSDSHSLEIRVIDASSNPCYPPRCPCTFPEQIPKLINMDMES